MFSAAELIETLQQRHRRRFPLHADRPFGGFPPTWRAWFLAMGDTSGALIGAPPGDYVSIFASRPLRAPPKAPPPIDRWRGLARLVRQQWEPAPRDERGIRRFAAVCSGLLHLLFGVLLLWLGLVAVGDAPPEAREAGEATLVEYVGLGTPIETGGAPAPGEVDAPAAAAAAPARIADAAPPAAAASPPSPPPPTVVEDAATPPIAAAAPQPLVVTETAQPDPDFSLPAPVQRDPALPRLQVRVPEVAVQAADIETFEAKTPVQAIERPTPRIAAPRMPTLRTDVVEVETQRLPTPVTLREAPPAAARVPQLRVPELRNQPGEVQLRPRASPAPATGTGATSPAATTAAAAASGTAPTSNASTTGTSTAPSMAPVSGGRPQANGSGRPAASAASGVGPAPSSRPGAAPNPVRGDDWGASNRNVPGNSTAGRAPGLFNSDGSVRLPGDSGRAGGGLPPGTVIEDFEKIDRMGTWLKRPPLDYTPSRFDRFWIPHENLLEEWVRRGVKNVAIPLPGTSKRIVCKVSLLQVGGGCTIEDPNLQDQEAIARPPPDVPFKPELQQDQDSLSRPPPSP